MFFASLSVGIFGNFFLLLLSTYDERLRGDEDAGWAEEEEEGEEERGEEQEKFLHPPSKVAALHYSFIVLFPIKP